MTATDPFIKICAWCHPEDHRPNVSHGICPKHREEMRKQIQEMFKGSTMSKDGTVTFLDASVPPQITKENAP